MVKTDPRYISFDNQGQFVPHKPEEGEETTGTGESAGLDRDDLDPAALKEKVVYALDAIVEAAQNLPQNASRVVEAAQQTIPQNASRVVEAAQEAAQNLPQNASRVMEAAQEAAQNLPQNASRVMQSVADMMATEGLPLKEEGAAPAAPAQPAVQPAGDAASSRPRAFVVASAKNARAFALPMEQAGIDVVFATYDNKPLSGFGRRELPTYNVGKTSALVDMYALYANEQLILDAAEAVGAQLLFFGIKNFDLASNEHFLERARAKGMRVFAPAAEGTMRMGWLEHLPAAVHQRAGQLEASETPWDTEFFPREEGEPDQATTWRTCHKCKLAFDSDSLQRQTYVCPNCATLLRLSSDERIAVTLDEGSFEEWNAVMPDWDPLEFPGYQDKLAGQREKSGLNEAVRTGKGTIAGLPVAVGIMEAGFFMGSMGHVVGEKISQMIDRAIEEQLPVVIFCASGGARMQEGLHSLMQMAKVSCAVERLGRAGLVYISVLTDPTTGGVTASFATEADIILAEPHALIGFAGQRVIRDTIRQELPKGFQTAEFALSHGLIDAIVPREDMRSTLAHLIALHAPIDHDKLVSYHGVEEALSRGTDSYGTVEVSEHAREEKLRIDAETAAGAILSSLVDAADAVSRAFGLLDDVTQEGQMREMDRQLLKAERRGGVSSQAEAGSAWESVQIARNVHRPTAQSYIDHMAEGYVELHGDRMFADDGAIVGGLGWVAGRPVTIIAQEKGSDLKDRVARHFGCPLPEGYRKSKRLMAQAAKFNRPIVCLVDTQGAHCDTAAEERGQGNAIAENLVFMAGLPVPVVSVLLGEGGSGGALALAVANRVAMQEHAVYSVLSPEGFASILWKDRTRAAEAAGAMQMDAASIYEDGLIDAVISEGEGPAHENPESAFRAVTDYVAETLKELEGMTPDELIQQRHDRFARF